MILDLRDIFLQEGSIKNFEYSFSMSNVEIGGIYPFVSPIMVKGEAKNNAGLVDVVFDVVFLYRRPCDRCMEDVERSLNYQLVHRLAVSLQGDENDSYIEVPDYTLDIDELLTADIILDLPAKYLCKEDCLGLCSVCGKNLNNGDCDCSEMEVDSRLEALKKLLN